MSNLGPYQEFTTQAKAAGGVDALLDAIKRDAVSEAAPKFEGRGVIIGAIITAAAFGIAEFIRHKKHERDQSNQNAKKAEETLHALTDSSSTPTNYGDDRTPDQIDPLEQTEPQNQTHCEGANDANRS
jgi:hypothetical protein